MALGVESILSVPAFFKLVELFPSTELTESGDAEATRDVRPDNEERTDRFDGFLVDPFNDDADEDGEALPLRRSDAGTNTDACEGVEHDKFSAAPEGGEGDRRWQRLSWERGAGLNRREMKREGRR